MTNTVCFDAELIRRYDRNGPRYTSYPTAVQFHTGFGPEQYKKAAADNNATLATPLSLYVHIPFCSSPCFYCGCNKIITHDVVKAQRYLDYLYREIAMQAPLFSRSRTVQQLHFGGGTPTFLSLQQLECLIERLKAEFHLTGSPTREYSIEIDPRTLKPESLPALAQMGFNRVSLGVQDFDPEVQRAVNRVQSAVETLRAIANARRA
ncbi:MAG TPA: radical SAM protein, partial [Steroidobacteraceae bacterium]|nr:radical SAM protein [Steroidobacteraceae bacterium]